MRQLDKIGLCLAVLFIVSGCALQKSVRQPLVNRQSWTKLHWQLQQKSPQIARVLRADVLARLSDKAQPLAEKALFIQLVSGSSQPLVRADAAFFHLNNLVTGDERSQQSQFAKALADYLFSDAMVCKKPVLGHYFQRRYSDVSVANVECSPLVPFYVVDRYQAAHIRWVDLNRVSSVHLLFAGPGSGIASRFGHVALRLVICPEKARNSQSCDSNLYQHLVLGYAAQVDEFTLNSFKGVMGDYQAHLYALPFMQVYRQYTIDEFRPVYSLPLRLDPQQRRQLVRELAEIHWRYAGQYRFFSQNCASLLENALTTLLKEVRDADAFATHYIRPDHLFHAAADSEVFRKQALVNLSLAEKNGYYFASTEPIYAKALQVVNKASQRQMPASVDEYLQFSPAERLAKMHANGDYWARLHTDNWLWQAQRLLEELAYVRTERLLFAEMSVYLQQLTHEDLTRAEQPLSPQQKAIFEHCLVKPITEALAPLVMRSGIPVQGEKIMSAHQEKNDCRMPAQRRQLATIAATIDIQDKQQWQQVRAAGFFLGQTLHNLQVLNMLPAHTMRMKKENHIDE